MWWLIHIHTFNHQLRIIKNLSCSPINECEHKFKFHVYLFYRESYKLSNGIDKVNLFQLY